MTNRKTSRRALVLSILSLLVCCSMLVGTTFAWFTDSVQSGNNQIVAGNLDIELYNDVEVNANAKVSESTKLFEDIKLWEPGVVAYENLTVANEGTLALKYQLSVNFTNANATPEGKTLADVLKVAFIEGGVDTTLTRDALVASITEWDEMKSFVQNGQLQPGETAPTTDVYGIVIYWEPGANDNDYNMNNGNQGTQLSIDLGVNLYATQLMSEEDSFGKDYDEGARFDVIPADVTTPNNDMELSLGFEWALRTALSEAGISVAKDETLSYTHLQQIKGKLDLSNSNIGDVITVGNKDMNEGYGATAVVDKLTEEEKQLFDGFTIPWAISPLAYGLINVTELDLSNTGIKYIPSKFLLGNPTIEKITLPSTVVSIGYTGTIENSNFGWGYNAFAWMKSLKTINMPASLKYLGEFSFAESPNLELNIETIPALTASGRKIFRVVDCKNAGYLTESKVTGDVAVFAEKNKNAELADFIFEGTAVTGDAAKLSNNPLTYRSTFGNIAGISGTLSIPKGATLSAWMFDGWGIDTLIIPYSTTVNGQAFANNTELDTVYVTYEGAEPGDAEKAAFINSLFYNNVPTDVRFVTATEALREQVGNAAAGSTILLNADTYDLSGSTALTITQNNITLQGAGAENTVIKASDSALNINASGVKLSGLTIEVAMSGAGATAPINTNNQNLTIENCNITRTTQTAQAYGYLVDVGSGVLTAKNTVFTAPYDPAKAYSDSPSVINAMGGVALDGCTIATDGYGLFAQHVTKGTIQNTTFTGVAGRATLGVFNCTILDGLEFDGCTFDMGLNSTVAAGNFTVKNSTFDFTNTPADGAGNAISLYSQNGPVVLTGNTFKLAAGVRGINLTWADWAPGDHDAADLTITGNVFENTGACAIRITNKWENANAAKLSSDNTLNGNGVVVEE